jgi:L-asparagine transporter-like permease
MIKVFIVCTLIFFGLVVVFVPLYQIKDSHYGMSNVCNEFLYPETCGSGTKRAEN